MSSIRDKALEQYEFGQLSAEHARKQAKQAVRTAASDLMPEFLATYDALCEHPMVQGAAVKPHRGEWIKWDERGRV